MEMSRDGPGGFCTSHFGVSAGAGFGAALAIVAGSIVPLPEAQAVPMTAFVFAALSCAIVASVGRMRGATADILVLAGIAPAAEAEGRIRQALTSGHGLQKFAEMIEAQGGDPRVIDRPDLLPLSGSAVLMCADRAGIFAACDAGLIGQAAVALGAGRDTIDDVVDLGVGIDVIAEIGAPVQVGDPLLRVYYREPRRLEVATLLLTPAIHVTDERADGLPLFIETIDRTQASKAFEKQAGVDGIRRDF